MGGKITDWVTKNEQPNWEWSEANIRGFNSQCKEMKVSENGWIWKIIFSEVTQTRTK